MSTTHIHQLVSFIDLTTLDSTDTEQKVHNLIEKANLGIDGTQPAAICLFPHFADFASKHTHLPIAVVAGNFPLGQTFTASKVNEVKLAALSPASEIDVVIDRGKILQGDFGYLQNELRQMREASNGKKLKVILESAELTIDELQMASRIAIEEGADFIKTSTGKSAIGATHEAARTMCNEIKRWYDQTGKKVGFKPSGGIKTYTDAMGYYSIVDEILGQAWLDSQLFRIGASSLFDHLKIQLQK